MYEAKLKAQRDRAYSPKPYEHPQEDRDFNKSHNYYPPWAKAAQDAIKKPKTALKDVKDKLSGYEKEDTNLTTKIEDLKLKLIKAETEQIEVRGRIECMKAFLADENTLTITEWILED